MKRESWVALDGLRGLSIIFVVLVHLWAHADFSGEGIPVTLSFSDYSLDITWIFATGSNAVIIFFALSGFLLYRHWLEKIDHGKYRDVAASFYKKRALRILPGFVFFLMIYYIIVLMLGEHHFTADLRPSNIFLNVTFLSCLAPLFNSTAATSLDIVPGTWSLNAEIWFYLLLPALAYILAFIRVPWAFLIALSLIAPIYRASLAADASFMIRYALPGVCDGFLLGMAVAALSTQAAFGRAAAMLFPLGALWYIFTCADVGPVLIDDRFQLAAASAFMIAGLIASGDWPWKRWMANTAIAWTGRISYSMFLCNVVVVWYIVLPFSEIFGVSSSGVRFLLNLLIGFPVVYLFGWAGYTFVEAPFLRRDPAPWRMRRLPATVAAGSFAALSLGLGAVAYVVRDGISVEFAGPAVSLAARLAPSSMTGAGLRPVALLGAPTVVSSTGGNPIEVDKVAPSIVHIKSDGLNESDAWVAVNFPVNQEDIARGQRVFLRAMVSVKRPSDAEACLGIFNGKEDVCSTRVQLSKSIPLAVETSAADGAPLQFKFNIFPNGDSKPLALSLEDLRAYQEIR
ncbi:MAG: acyltransferase [Rhodomicrobium sp.]